MAQVEEIFTAEHLHLDRFKPQTMRDSCVVVLVAMKGSGKSTCMADFMWHKRHIPSGFIFSATEESNHFFSQMVPAMYCYNDLNIEKLQDIYDYQEVKMAKYKRPAEEIKQAKIAHGDPAMDDNDLEKIDFWAVWERDPHIFGTIEDLMADRAVFNKTIMRHLFMNGRHHKMFVMITVQYVMDMPRNLRSNVDYWVLFKEDSAKNRENLFLHVANKCKSRQVFEKIMDEATKNYGCVVIDNRCNTGRIEDAVFWYRAKKRPPFRCGSERFWQFAKKNYIKPESQHKELVERMQQRIRGATAKRDRSDDDDDKAQRNGRATATRKTTKKRKTAFDPCDDDENAQIFAGDADEQQEEDDAAFLKPKAPKSRVRKNFDVIRKDKRLRGAAFSVVMDEKEE